MNYLLWTAVACMVFGVAFLVFKYQHSDAVRARRQAEEVVRQVTAELQETRKILAEAEEELREAAEKYKREIQLERLQAVTLDDVKGRAGSGVRTQPLRDRGIQNLAHLQGWSAGQLMTLRGIGPDSAGRLEAAVRQLTSEAQARPIPFPRLPFRHEREVMLVDRTYREMRTREAVEGRVRELEREYGRVSQVSSSVKARTTPLGWLNGGDDSVKVCEAKSDAEALVNDLSPTGRTGRAVSQGRAVRERVRRERAEAIPRSTVETQFEQEGASIAARLDEFLGGGGRRPVTARAGFSSQGRPGVSPSGALPLSSIASHGNLPEEIAARVEAFPLRLDALRPGVHLRRYQAFGAKYVLELRRSMLGDEMGLGKTVEALAAMAHLQIAENRKRFMVVAPAGVTRNWANEIERFTSLRPMLPRSADRDATFTDWRAYGGVAIVSYDTLRGLYLGLRPPEIDLLVVDEAHYVKNPGAQRTQAVANLIPNSDRVCFMTGTPLENRLAEFRSLATLVSPAIGRRLPEPMASGALDVDPDRFHREMAAVYLRRNQEDVLLELPERIDVAEWVDLGADEQSAYETAVRKRDLMAMRRTATIGTGAGSSKLDRLEELLEGYRDAGEKVIVFSFFLDVLRSVAHRFGALGTIHGSVSADERMALIQRFREHQKHGLLLSQIEAGGVGLNIQAASVVVLMEPQWKPSTEEQAIARVHRMGQVRRVMVHRLLARNAIDERLVEVLSAKQGVFDGYARGSAIRDLSSEATETSIAERVLEAEFRRVGGTAA